MLWVCCVLSKSQLKRNDNKLYNRLYTTTITTLQLQLQIITIADYCRTHELAVIQPTSYHTHFDTQFRVPLIERLYHTIEKYYYSVLEVPGINDVYRYTFRACARHICNMAPFSVRHHHETNFRTRSHH